MAKNGNDGSFELEGKVKVTVDQPSAEKAFAGIQKSIAELERHPIKVPFDSSIFREYESQLKKLGDLKTAIFARKQGASSKDDLSITSRADLAQLELQIKALERLRVAAAQLNRDQIAFGAKRQNLVTQFQGMSDADIEKLARTSRGRGKLASGQEAVKYQQQFAASQENFSKKLLDAGFKQASVDMALLADQLKVSAKAVSGRLSQEYLSKIRAKTAEDVAKLDAMHSAALTEDKKRTEAARAKSDSARNKEIDLIVEENKWRAKNLKDKQRQAETERAYNLKHASGISAVAGAGGIGNFDPSLLTSKASAASARSYLTAERNRLSTMGADASKAQAALDKLTNSHVKYNESVQHSSNLLKTFFRYAVGYQALYQVLGAVSALARGVVDLDKSLYDIRAVTQATTADMVSLTGAVTDAAVNTKFSTTEVAEATKTLAQAGTDLKDIPATLTAVTDFAAATGGALQVSADILTTMKEVYKSLSPAQAANQLTQAVNQSKLTTEDLKVITSTAAQITESYGVTSEQFLAQAAILRNDGIKASTAATGLSQAALEVFTLDSKSLKALAKKYHAMGEEMTTGAIQRMYAGFTKTADPMMAVLTELKRVGVGTDTTLNRLFDKRAMNVLIPLINNMEDLEVLQSKLTFGQPAAVGAGIAMGSLSSQVGNLGSAFVALGHQLTEGPLSSLKEVVQWATKAVESIRQANLESRASGNGDSAWVRTSRALGEIANPLGLLGAVALHQRNKPTSTEELKQETAALRQLADQAHKEVARLQEARNSFDPETTGANSLGATISSITDGLVGTHDQIRAAKLQLSGVAAITKKELDRMSGELSDALASGDSKRAGELSGVFAKLQTDIPDARDILNQTGVYADPARALEGVKAIMALLRDTQYSLRSIAEAQSAEAQAVAKTNVKEAEAIISNESAVAMQAMVSSFISTVDMLGASAAADRLHAMQAAIESALATETDPTKLAALRSSLGGVTAAFSALDTRVAKEKGAIASSAAAPRTPEQLAAFRASDAGKAFEASSPGYVDFLNPASLGEGAAYLKDPKNLRATPEGGYRAVTQVDGAANRFEEVGKAAAAMAVAEWIQANPDKVAEAVVEKDPETYIPDVEVSKKTAALEMQIDKIQEFGGAAGELASLVNKKNDLMLQEQARAVSVAAENAKLSGSDADEKKLADEQIQLEKMKVQASKESLDAVSKGADAELKAYQTRAKNLLDADESADLGALSAEFKARQEQAIADVTAWGEANNLSKEAIQREIEKRGLLTQSLITDKMAQDLVRKGDKEVASILKAMPKSATTGEGGAADAFARANGGFTDAQNAGLYRGKIQVSTEAIAKLREASASRRALASGDGAGAEEAEMLRNAADAADAQIVELTNDVQDLQYQLSEMGTTGEEQLNRAFGPASIQAYTTALQNSQSALKNWGANLRGEVLSAWESIGDAITDSVMKGESFNELMKNIVKDFAGGILRTSVKTSMNLVAQSVLGAVAGGGGAPTAEGGAAPAAKKPGLLGSIFSAVGLGGGATGGATATGSMTVTAASVNIIGGEAGAKSAVESLVGKPGEKGGFWDSITSGFSSIFSGIGGIFSGMFGGGKSGSDSSSWVTGVVSAVAGAFGGSAKGAGGAANTGSGGAGYNFGDGASLFAATGYVDSSGIIRGPGTGTSDSIPAFMRFKSGHAPIMISNTESILTAKATNFLGADTIRNLNKGMVSGFSSGKVAQAAARSGASVNRDSMRPVVNVPEQAPPEVHVHPTLDAKEVVAKGLSNNPAVKRELFKMVGEERKVFSSILQKR